MKNIKHLFGKKQNRNFLIVVLVSITGIILIAFSKVVKPIKIVYPLKIRRDGQGDGGFGTSRSYPYKTHYGIDLVVSQGQPVFAPFGGVVKIVSKALRDKDGYTGVKIETTQNLLIDVLYITPAVKQGQAVKEGQLIGYAQDIRQAYGKIPEMLNHIHVEHYDSINKQFLNPTAFYFPTMVSGSVDQPIIQVSDDFYQNYKPHQFD